MTARTHAGQRNVSKTRMLKFTARSRSQAHGKVWTGSGHPGTYRRPLKPVFFVTFFSLRLGLRIVLRAHAQIPDNFRSKSFACGNLSLLTPYFRLFQRRLGAPGSCPRDRNPTGCAYGCKGYTQVFFFQTTCYKNQNPLNTLHNHIPKDRNITYSMEKSPS